MAKTPYKQPNGIALVVVGDRVSLDSLFGDDNMYTVVAQRFTEYGPLFKVVLQDGTPHWFVQCQVKRHSRKARNHLSKAQL